MDWKTIQAKLNLKADGVAGPVTFKALYEYAAGRSLGDVGDKLAKASQKYFAPYGMTTPERIAEFIAQICNETGGFRVWEEDLHYSAQNALKTWPTHFNPQLAAWAHMNPERIAEVAYGVKSRQGHGRMGNTAPGDGYKYRGRGALQLTGKDNYKEFGRILSLDLVNHPELAADPEDSLLIALLFFKKGNVNAAVDDGDYLGARKITNMGNRYAKGTPIGLTHVADYRNKILALLKTKV